MADLSVVKSEPLPGLHVVKSDPLPGTDPGKGTYGHEGYKSPLPSIAGKMDEVVSDSVNWMAEGLRKVLHGSSADERLGGASQILHGFANSAGVPMVMEAGIAAPLRTALGLGTGLAAQQGATAGARALGAGEGTSNFLGDAAGLVVGGAASRDGAPTAAKGAVKGAYQAATEMVPLRKLGVDVSLPAPLVTGAATAAAARAVGIPHEIGAIVGAGAPIVKGAVTGAKAALAERVNQAAAKARQATVAADAAAMPPDVLAELTRESEPAATPPPQPPAPEPAPVAAQPPPTALQQFEALKAKLPGAPPNLAQQLYEEMQRSGTAPVEVPEEAAAVEAPKNFAAGARTAKANKLAQALHQGGIPFEDARMMDASNWKMLADGIGVKVPSAASIAETLGQLKRLSVQ